MEVADGEQGELFFCQEPSLQEVAEEVVAVVLVVVVVAAA